MNTSLRLSEELNSLLNNAVLKTGKKRSQIIREALETYCLALDLQSEGSLYDRLIAGNWEPVKTGISNLSTDKDLLRRRVRERAARRNA
ncbi:MAG TPA: ribbon-helix-helix protein, CopG family [Candidatus Obscuribacterales bacterium]